MVWSTPVMLKQRNIFKKFRAFPNSIDTIIPCFVTGYDSLQNTFILILLFKPHNNHRRKTGQGLLSSFSWWYQTLQSLNNLSKSRLELELHSDAELLPMSFLLCHSPTLFLLDEMFVALKNKASKARQYSMDCHHKCNCFQKEFLVLIEVPLNLVIDHRKGQLP